MAYNVECLSQRSGTRQTQRRRPSASEVPPSTSRKPDQRRSIRRCTVRGRKYRVGDYRPLQIEDDRWIVLVLRVGHRKEIH
jgi:mRNA-degrading endonuclease RelE of RelBE toxin-antitoxin system